jgi:hypothetical protein
MENNENQMSVLQKLYEKLYQDLKLENGYKENRKFQNNIRIGSNYFGWMPKILIVGLDAGYDNGKPLGEIKFEKEIIISVKGKVNPHMAGVYGTVLHFQTGDKWQAQKEDLLQSKTFQSFTKDSKKLSSELLSSFAIVNFYSFVTKDRRKATGNKDRVFVNEEIEIEHLIKLIDTINPDIIVVQNKGLKRYFKNIQQSINNKSTQIYLACHPAVFGKHIKYRNPQLYFENLTQIISKK